MLGSNRAILEQAFLRMETLPTNVESSPRFELPDQRNLMVTIGVAQYPRDAKDARGLLQAADAARATAQKSGRNQVALPPNEEMVMKSCYYRVRFCNLTNASSRRPAP